MDKENMNRGKTFAKNSLVYALGKGLTLLVSVFLLPLYTSRIVPDNYGYFETTRSIIDLLIPFLCCEMWAGVFRLYFLKSNSEKEKNNLLATSFYFCTFIAIIISIGFAFAGIFGNARNWPLSIFLIFSTTYSLLFMYFARSLKRNLIFSISGIVASLVNACAGLLLVMVFKFQEEAMFLALSFGYLAQILVIFVSLKLWKIIKTSNFSFQTLKRILGFSWPLGISTVLYYLSKGFIQLLISAFLADAYVAFFSVSLRFTSIIIAFANILSMSWMDIVYNEKDDDKRRKLLSFWTPQFYKFFSILSLFMIPFIGIAFNILVAEEYKDALALLPISMACSYFILSSGILINPLHSENKTRFDMYAKAIAAVFAISVFFACYNFSPFYAGIVAYLAGCIAEYISLHYICKKVVRLDISFYPTIVFVVLYLVTIVSFVFLPSFITLFIAFAILLFGIIYCWDVISIVFRKIIPNLPLSMHDFLKSKIISNKQLALSILLFVTSLSLSFISLGFINGKVFVFIILIILSAISWIASIMLSKKTKEIKSDILKNSNVFSLLLIPIVAFSISGLFVSIFDYYLIDFNISFGHATIFVLAYAVFYVAYFRKKCDCLFMRKEQYEGR